VEGVISIVRANRQVLEYFNENCPTGDDGQRALWSRIGNQLARGGVLTMNQLCEMPPEEIGRVRNIGKKSLPIIFTEIEKYRQGQ